MRLRTLKFMGHGFLYSSCCLLTGPACLFSLFRPKLYRGQPSTSLSVGGTASASGAFAISDVLAFWLICEPRVVWLGANEPAF